MLLHITWSVNSAAHLYGTRPFDKYVYFCIKNLPFIKNTIFSRNLKPVESHFVAFVSVGEGWHNYHHAFPWDYRASEYGAKYNLSTFVINILAAMGLAYDLKVAPYSMVQYRALRAGDGTHEVFGTEAQEKYGKIAFEQSKKMEMSTPEDTIKSAKPTVNHRPLAVKG